MKAFSASARVLAPTEHIWPVIADVERWPEWLPTMTSVEGPSNSALAKGNRYKLVQPGFRPTLWTVVELAPQQSFAWEARWPGARAVARHSVYPAAVGSSYVVLEVLFSGPLGFLAGALARSRIKAFLALEVATLKQKVEQPPS